MTGLIHDPLLLPLGGKRKAERSWLCPLPWVPHGDRGSPGLAHGNTDPFLGAVATLGGFPCKASWALGVWRAVRILGLGARRHESALDLLAVRL